MHKTLKKLVFTFLFTALGHGVAVADGGSRDNADPNFDAFLIVDVDVNVSNLTEGAKALVISCAVVSYFDGAGVVGEGKAFIYDPATYDTAAITGSDLGRNENITFIAAPNVFGTAGSREYIATVEVLVLGEPEKNLLESWKQGGCDLTLDDGSATFSDGFDELLGYSAIDCNVSPSALLQCIRPGSSLEDSYFDFTRDFDERGGFFTDGSGATGAASDDDGN